jgi:hypothetical protein
MPQLNGRGGQIPVQTALSGLPPWLQNALYRGAAKGGLTESDPLWGCLLATAEQLKATAEHLDAQAGGTKRSVDELTQAIRTLSQSVESRVQPRPVERRVEVEHPVEPKSRPKNIGKWVATLIAAGAVFGAGYFFCWRNTYSEIGKAKQQAEEQVDRVIGAQPTANLVSSFLAKHSGNISIGRIISPDGTRETEGIIISPGDLKFGQPTFSKDGGNVLVPVP